MADVTIQGPDGSFGAYLSKPASGSGPGLLVIQEIFGVNHVMRDICDGYAALGYVALCPDLFWRQEPGIQITDKTEAEWAKAFELYKGFSEARESRTCTRAWSNCGTSTDAPAGPGASASAWAASWPTSWRPGPARTAA